MMLFLRGILPKSDVGMREKASNDILKERDALEAEKCLGTSGLKGSKSNFLSPASLSPVSNTPTVRSRNAASSIGDRISRRASGGTKRSHEVGHLFYRASP